jgi:hypothetical protein
MTTTDRLEIAYGRKTYPDTVDAVWGARLIEPDDLVYNRQDLAARDDESKQALIAWLNGTPEGTGAIAKMREKLGNYGQQALGLYGNTDTEAVIYEDDTGIIVGSCQRSYGYVYVAGWLKGASA